VVTQKSIESSSAPPVEELQGVVERLTYHSEESGYTVARLKAPRVQDLVTIVGNFANIQAGQTLQLHGFWRDHPKYGAQFQVKSYHETKPATITGIEKYLGSGLIKGVGPVTARRIVAHFGLDTLDIIENQIARLIEVPGIAKKRVTLIQTAWQEQNSIKEVMLFLQSHGVSTTYAVKIYKKYGDESIDTVSQNPYRLATDIYGIGFITADAIARHIGIEPSSEYRYRSGIIQVLNEAAEEGHCLLPHPELIDRAVKRLALKEHQPKADQIEVIAHLMIHEGELVAERGDAAYEGVLLYYIPSFFQAEYRLSQRLQQLLMSPIAVDSDRVRRWIERWVETTSLSLSTQQLQAIEMAASQRVLILTGGPGTGKTFTTRTIVALWKAMGKAIALASPTGRAAQRLAEVTGREAKTIHRLLEFDPKTMQFKRDLDNPLPVDAVVVDEASMLDVFLANSLMKAIDPTAQILLVGDTDQLPSVGPGNVLGDLIRSGVIPVVQLNQVFRQAQTSAIIRNAHQINQGQFPQLERVTNLPKSDCLWMEAQEPEQGAKAIQDLVTALLPSLEFDAARDLQVLCPMTRGEVGTRNLNHKLQALINPPHSHKSEITRAGFCFRVGDRVIQQVNDYTREVFNGDLGVIDEIDPEEQSIVVRYDGRQVTYDLADLNEIAPAWAVTVHKAQGSEYPVVILPLFMAHYLMLSRNLLYTGLTRAKQLVILVGPRKAIALAVNQVKDRERYTLLSQRLI
jgi:exodeoxyribonuclease V alpha subunit